MDRAGLPLDHVRWAAVGRATADTLSDLGVPEAWTPSRADGATLGAELPLAVGDAVLLARGDLAGPDLPEALLARGVQITDVVAYTTTEGPPSSGALLAAALERAPQAVILGSASAVRGIVALAGMTPHGSRRLTSAVHRTRYRRRCPYPRLQACPGVGSADRRGARRPRPRPPAGPRVSLIERPRRLRGTIAMRRLVRETRLHPAQLVAPLFVRPGEHVREPIGSLPGQYRLSVDETVREAERLAGLGIGGLLLFGLPASKDEQGSGAWLEDGIVQQALRALRERRPAARPDGRHLPLRVHLPRALRSAAAERQRGQRPCPGGRLRRRPSPRPRQEPTSWRRAR